MKWAVMLVPLRVGIDVGSTTVKIAVLDSTDTLVWSSYQRHGSDIRGALIGAIKG